MEHAGRDSFLLSHWTSRTSPDNPSAPMIPILSCSRTVSILHADIYTVGRVRCGAPLLSAILLIYLAPYLRFKAHFVHGQHLPSNRFLGLHSALSFDGLHQLAFLVFRWEFKMMGT